MHLSPLSIAAIMLGTTSAFSITAYNNVEDCNADSNTVYRVFSDIQAGFCYSFAPNSDGQYQLPCRQYNKGGIENSDCNFDALFPSSAVLDPTTDGQWCTAWTADGCQGSYGESRGYTEPLCVAPRFEDSYRSFSCGPTGK